MKAVNEGMGNKQKRSNEAEIKSKNKNVGDIYRDISDLSNACERRKELRELRERGCFKHQHMLSLQEV